MHDNNPKRQFWVILFIIFLGFLGISVPYLIFPALFLNPAYTIIPPDWNPSTHALFLGVTLAAYPLGQFIGSPVLGALSDDYGRKRFLSGSLVAASFCYLLTGIALQWEILWLVIFSRFAAGLMEGNIAIARAMAADLKSLSKHETFGKINAVASIAYLLGPLLGGLLADNNVFDWATNSTPFYLVSFFFLLLAPLSAMMLQEDKPTRSHMKKIRSMSFWSRLNLLKKMSHLFQNKKIRFLMIVSTTFTIAIDIFYEFGPVHLTKLWMIGPAQLVVYNSILCLTLAIGNGWLASYLSKRYSAKRGILWAMGGFALLLFCMALTDYSAIMILLYGLSGLVIGVGVTFLTVKISDAAPDSIQGEVMGTQLSLRVLGDAFICILGGVLLLISSQLILILASMISGLAMLYFAMNHSKERDHRDQQDQ